MEKQTSVKQLNNFKIGIVSLTKYKGKERVKKPKEQKQEFQSSCIRNWDKIKNKRIMKVEIWFYLVVILAVYVPTDDFHFNIKDKFIEIFCCPSFDV